MAYDYDVHYEHRRPSRKEIEAALRGYLGTAATVEWKTDRFFVSFDSKPSNPFSAPRRDDDRWFEVWLGTKLVSCITRMQDEFVHAVTLGFCKAVARRWKGVLSE
jgi:hypothetical protein